MRRFSTAILIGCGAVLVTLAIPAPKAHAGMRFGSVAGASIVAAPAEALPAADPLELPYVEPFEMAAPLQVVTTTNLFAQIAFGGGFTTIFSFANTGSATATGNLILNDDTGQPLVASFTSPGLSSSTGFSFPLSVSAGGVQEVVASPVNPAADPTKTGWARVESTSGSFGGVATFQFAPGGVLSVIVGVLSAAGTSSATIPVDDNHANQVDTGYAIANPGTTPINIKIIFVNPDGSIFRSVTSPPLAPGAHTARYLWQDANDTAFVFRGSAVMIEQAGQPFSIVALVLNHNLLTAVPVIPGNAPNIR